MYLRIQILIFVSMLHFIYGSCLAVTAVEEFDAVVE